MPSASPLVGVRSRAHPRSTGRGSGSAAVVVTWASSCRGHRLSPMRGHGSASLAGTTSSSYARAPRTIRRRRSSSCRAHTTSARRSTTVLIALCGAFGVRSIGWRWAVGVVVLAAAILGDFHAIPLGVAPVVAAVGLLDGRRAQADRCGALPLVSAGGLRRSSWRSWCARLRQGAAGGFQPHQGEHHLRPHGQMVRNLVHLPNEALSLLGLVSGPFGPSGVPACPRGAPTSSAVVALVAAVLVAGWAMLTDLRHRPMQPQSLPADGLDRSARPRRRRRSRDVRPTPDHEQ